ncbi:hypothetical protein A3D78_06215 [Candidatus Gottesmanbacteria bacterium RIFCSPHIGHO2_02_FULL_39_14]|uniref:ATP synthase F1 complex delta/epsilon subunit N-terminal domain-containing protein n=2 Tax=Candidatus Gottesmaniibacteriota TaxID=1752720 RepID=A0A1F6A3W7_9BACT|nr:MAG: hypothetical protein A3D78_06215 [Candidatus Gottesmanbacteria bacterium RIFCSPHIGHO2_02_FULL_39_14]OGG32437.1 MAG: hypothetical protein A3I51_02615 [Candidatus Gottesmanbacteria bacterium RIFCSPLOWO2_02_FULL_38_8]
MPESLLTVEISSPEKQIWKGEAKSVSSKNIAGPFDILPLHANFITIIENQPIKIATVDKIEEFKFTNAIIYASKNRVLIYTI